MKLVLAGDLGFAILLGPLLTESDTRQSHQTFKGGSWIAHTSLTLRSRAAKRKKPEDRASVRASKE